MTATQYLKQELGEKWSTEAGLTMRDKTDLISMAKTEMAALGIPLTVAS